MSVSVYAIRTATSEDVYVGSTTQSLAERFCAHKGSYRHWVQGKTNYCSSFPLVADPTCRIELLETCESEARYERERHWIETTSNCVNQVLPGRTKPEYQKAYYQAHKEEIDAQHKAWNIANIDDHRAYHREYMKVWVEDNRKAYNEYQREYQKKWREKKRTAKITG